VAGKNFVEILQGDKTDVTAKKLMNHKIKKGYAFEGEIMKYTKSGKPFWVEVSGQPILNAKGELSNYFMMETDITERKKAYQKLLKKENEIRSFAVQLNNVLEDERSRIAREIHDEFGQQLTGLKMSLSSLEKSLGSEKKSKDIIHDMLTGVQNTIQSLRNFATELRPGILDTLGLVPSIEWLGKSFEKKSGIQCSLKIDTKTQIFEKILSTAYFRICQEGLTNIVKHAEATKVLIEVTQHDSELTLKITDNGKGIVPDSLEDPFSMGLLGIRERASLIGATLEINSTKDTGTSIQITTKL
jgi:signal transduction histidine kinase